MKFLINCLNKYPVLQAAFWLNVVTLLLSLAGLAVDDRLLLNESVWLKPMKFSISISIYCLTIAWLLSVYPYNNRTKQLIAWVTGGAMIIEIPLIMLQAFRGVRSHFNVATILDGSIFGIMGLVIFINSLVLLAMTGTAFLKELNTRVPVQRAIQFGWLAMIVSMLAGQIMISNMAHSTGVSDGGAGIPLTHWSTEGGDWRAVHFFGMHAIQLLPLLVWLLTRLNWKDTLINGIIWLTGSSYLLFLL